MDKVLKKVEKMEDGERDRLRALLREKSTTKYEIALYNRHNSILSVKYQWLVSRINICFIPG